MDTTTSRMALRAGRWTAGLSRRLGRGEGAIIGGRVTLALDPSALRRLAHRRRVVLVSGTNGKTTTSHLLATLLRTSGSVAHNATGANMSDGAVAALTAAPDAELAVLEVDELHVAAVAEAVDPAVVVLLNLSRDQLDRGNEVRMVAAAISQALRRHPDTCVVANADDPMVVWATGAAARVVWVAAGANWTGDTAGCPACGEALQVADSGSWSCTCGLARPATRWRLHPADDTVLRETAHLDGRTESIRVSLRLPGAFNLGNAALALAAAAELGIDVVAAAGALSSIRHVGGRYRTAVHGPHRLRLLLAKNPAGWAETLPLLEPDAARLLVVNARAADGRDTSWLWDVPFEQLAQHDNIDRGPGLVAVAGEKAHDLGLRLSYANIAHITLADPLIALTALPPGKVDVIANYTAFRSLASRLATTDHDPGGALDLERELQVITGPGLM
ncbi:domain of unknown function DUF1727 [Pseudonocardia dioxanivorans CB1190]|uniref:Lipid II isoglutaminyl synthase (glutamine-hydrolyzing) subunit MurT n=1 Tax=Pseudonocardia dioxanivorans (strain ATCC 55486 / DSM 44775 / JCM 13855 / CB1190) TaxID=675635 RepID=F4CLX7_PSEUX|nr:MurT ligase domain-containing protein [Pseudonocardia dioxanivorans]AEA22325.1 domain of unknown function DUF1727 [Pseudonocardia dioxanivorans CB1190]